MFFTATVNVHAGVQMLQLVPDSKRRLELFYFSYVALVMAALIILEFKLQVRRAC
jgi:hypothetical protein